MGFRPINYYTINIGELVRKSKTRTAWHFDLDGVRYVFELEHSQLTGKKKLLRNNCVVHEEKSLRKLFHHELRIGEHVIIFDQQSDGSYFDVRVDQTSFSYVYNRLKMDNSFEYEAGVN